MLDRPLPLIATMLLLLFTLPALAQTPAELDKFTGAYRATSIMVFHVRRDGSDLYLRPSGSQNEMALLPLGANEFRDTMSGGQFIFSGEGPDIVLTASHGITVFHAKRISEEAARVLEDAVAARVKADVPSPNTEASARRYIASLENGTPNYDEMEPRVAEEQHHTLPNELAEIHDLGALKSRNVRVRL